MVVVADKLQNNTIELVIKMMQIEKRLLKQAFKKEASRCLVDELSDKIAGRLSEVCEDSNICPNCGSVKDNMNNCVRCDI